MLKLKLFIDRKLKSRSKLVNITEVYPFIFIKE